MLNRRARLTSTPFISKVNHTQYGVQPLPPLLIRHINHKMAVFQRQLESQTISISNQFNMVVAQLWVNYIKKRKLKLTK